MWRGFPLALLTRFKVRNPTSSEVFRGYTRPDGFCADLYQHSNINEKGTTGKIEINQIFQYTRCITSKLVTSLRAHLRVIAPAGNTAPFEMLQRWQAVGNTVSDLTDPRFESQTSRSRDKRATARPAQFSHF